MTPDEPSRRRKRTLIVTLIALGAGGAAAYGVASSRTCDQSQLGADGKPVCATSQSGSHGGSGGYYFGGGTSTSSVAAAARGGFGATGAAHAGAAHAGAGS